MKTGKRQVVLIVVLLALAAVTAASYLWPKPVGRKAIDTSDSVSARIEAEEKAPPPAPPAEQPLGEPGAGRKMIPAK